MAKHEVEMGDSSRDEYTQRMLRHIECQMLFGDRGSVKRPLGMSTQDYQGAMNPGHTQQSHPHSIASCGERFVMSFLSWKQDKWTGT